MQNEAIKATVDFNPRSPHGERRLRQAFQLQKLYISIHAPRMGSDRTLANRRF